MPRKPVSTRILLLLLAPTVVLPIGCLLLAALASLLGLMGDSAGSTTLGWIAVGLGVVWLLGLVCLVLALAVNALFDSDDPAPRP